MTTNKQLDQIDKETKALSNQQELHERVKELQDILLSRTRISII